jgi:hypothetical protein
MAEIDVGRIRPLTRPGFRYGNQTHVVTAIEPGVV